MSGADRALVASPSSRQGVSTEGFNPGEGFTPGPWEVCQHLKSVADDAACRCGYRGVIFGPDPDIAYAICQPGHQPAPEGEEGTEPARYPRAVEIANAHLIAAAPDLYAALAGLLKHIERYGDGCDPSDAEVVAGVAALLKARGGQL